MHGLNGGPTDILPHGWRQVGSTNADRLSDGLARFGTQTLPNGRPRWAGRCFVQWRRRCWRDEVRRGSLEPEMSSALRRDVLFDAAVAVGDGESAVHNRIEAIGLSQSIVHPAPPVGRNGCV